MARKKRSDPEEDETAMIDAWSNWLETVPSEDRLAVGSIIRSCDISSRAGLNVFLLQLLAALFEGKIHPVVLASAKPMVTMLYTSIHLQCAENGTPQLAGPTLAQAILDMRSQIRERVRPLEAVYALEGDDFDDNNLIDAEVG